MRKLNKAKTTNEAQPYHSSPRQGTSPQEPALLMAEHTADRNKYFQYGFKAQACSGQWS